VPLKFNPTTSQLDLVGSGGGSGTPASPDKSIQFNDGGSFGGSAGLLFDKTTNVLTLGSIPVAGYVLAEEASPSGGKNALLIVNYYGATSGSIVWVINGYNTVPLAFDADNSTVQSAIETADPSVTGFVSVGTGYPDPYEIIFPVAVTPVTLTFGTNTLAGGSQSAEITGDGGTAADLYQRGTHWLNNDASSIFVNFGTITEPEWVASGDVVNNVTENLNITGIFTSKGIVIKSVVTEGGSGILTDEYNVSGQDNSSGAGIISWANDPTLVPPQNYLRGSLLLRNSEIGSIATVEINSGGTGYQTNDILTISGGDSNGTCKVTGVESGVITTVELITPGSSYSDDTGVGVTGGIGNDDATVDITINPTLGQLWIKDGENAEDWIEVGSKLTNSASGVSSILDTSSLDSTDKTFTFPNESGTFALQGGSIQKLSQTSGVDLTQTGVTVLYTVPSGQIAIITGVVFIAQQGDGTISTPATVGAGVAAGEDDIMPSTALTGFDTTNEIYRYSCEGTYISAQEDEVVNLGVDVAAAGVEPNLMVSVLLFGILFQFGGS
jgi:hypothetical protein